MRAKPPSQTSEVLAAGGLIALGGLAGGPLGAAGAALAIAVFGDKDMIAKEQMSQKYLDVIADEKKVYDDGATVTNAAKLPAIDDIPLIDRNKWIKVPDVICVYIDMKDSTKLTSAASAKDTASAFQLYTGTAVRLLNAFGSPYIDVRGDGAFGLFDAGQEHVALVAAVTFKTFAHLVAIPAIEKRSGIRVGSHIGIDRSGVLVRRVGLRRTEDRDDRQNEVWAGKPVNMAAKLAGMTADNELLVSKRFYDKVDHEKARKSCGCGSDGKKADLWKEVDVSKAARFDFELAYKLESYWCNVHGKEFMEALLQVEADKK